MKSCIQCKKEFEITDADREFYRKIKVPEPTLCPFCREQRRLMWRQERNLYPSACGLCGKLILSIYDPKNAYISYCPDCFYSDRWDASNYGRDIDFSRPFFDQFKELFLSVPHMSLVHLENENSDYAQLAGRCKNCYLVSAAWENEDCYYGRWIFNSKQCVDCIRIYENELCYSLIDSEKCYNTHFSRNSSNCIDSYFLENCSNCSHCFGCKNIKNKEYYIFNKQGTKDEYTTLVKSLGSYAHLQKYKQKFADHCLEFPSKYTVSKNAVDSLGCYIANSAFCTHCFDINKGERMTYCSEVDTMKDCYDIDDDQNGEYSYEIVTGAGTNYCRFVVAAINNSFADYCFESVGSEYVFGCVSMRKQKFSIFNKSYSEQEFYRLRDLLIEHMKKTGEWGEFFPAAVSPFAYNETMASWFFPLEKEDVFARGWRWQEQLPGTYGKETIAIHSLPDDISQTDDSITQEILACEICRRNYKIIKQELSFYRKVNFPLPRYCPDCRLKASMALRNSRTLWHRQCMCEKSDHEHADRCAVEFETTYAPERQEIIYCESCYQKEVV